MRHKGPTRNCCSHGTIVSSETVETSGGLGGTEPPATVAPAVRCHAQQLGEIGKSGNLQIDEVEKGHLQLQLSWWNFRA